MEKWVWTLELEIQAVTRNGTRLPAHFGFCVCLCSIRCRPKTLATKEVQTANLLPLLGLELFEAHTVLRRSPCLQKWPEFLPPHKRKSFLLSAKPLPLLPQLSSIQSRSEAMVLKVPAGSLLSPRASYPSAVSPVLVSSACSSTLPPNSHALSNSEIHFSKLTRKRGSLGVTRKSSVIARASTAQYSPSIAEALLDVTIFTAAGEPVMFRDLWDQNEVSIFRLLELKIWLILKILSLLFFLLQIKAWRIVNHWCALLNSSRELLLLPSWGTLDALAGNWPSNLAIETCFCEAFSNNKLSIIMLFVLSWELASALKESKARFDSAGVKLIAVGVGAPNKARILAERVIFSP